MSDPEEAPAWWQLELDKPEGPQTSLDLLPAELIERILTYLPSNDVCSVATSSKRLSDFVQGHPVLSLHLLDPLRRLQKATECSQTLSRVVKNAFLTAALDVDLTFHRTVACTTVGGLYNPPRNSDSLSKIYFNSWPKPDPSLAKKRRLLSVVNDVVGLPGPEGMTLVLANSDEEAFHFHQALLSEKKTSDICLAAVTREQQTRWLSATQDFLVCVPTLNLDLPEEPIRKIISFRPLRDLHDFVELESFCPDVVIHLVSTEQEQVAVVADIVRFLQPFQEAVFPAGPARRVWVDRSFYKVRARYNSMPSRPIFSDLV